jgi:hypothetical protein
MDEVKLLLKDVATPEAEVRFDPPSRSTPGSIQSNINPPQATWEWPNQAMRLAQPVKPEDVGKYGLQTDVNTLFELTNLSPVVWQPVQGFTTATWVWPNVYARNAQAVTAADVGKFGLQSDTNTYYQLTEASPPVWRATPNPTNTSSPFELATGASDAPSYHDFFRLQLAFQDVWEELVDPTIQRMGENLYAHWNALMDPQLDDTGYHDRLETFAKQDVPPDITISSVDELIEFINDLRVTLGITDSSTTSAASGELARLQDVALKTLTGCNMLLKVIDWAGVGGWQDSALWLVQPSGALNNDPLGDDLADLNRIYPGVQRGQVFDKIIADLKAPIAGPGPHQPTPSGPAVKDVKLQDLINQITALEDILKEKYRFDVFSPASINFGLVLNYRQRWEPQSYQVGNLISSIPLAPQETRRYTTKTVVKRSRSAKEINDSLRSGKDDASTTSRTDAEIVDRAKNQTNFQTNASGSYGNDNLYKISAALQQNRDQAVESAQTKHEFHEAVVKASQEYRNEHRTEIATEESREDESTSYQEIRNPNDELTVTYLFYELQRRFLVDEALHKVTPVILVANEVPGPEQIDQGWILRHDWIIKRAILDDSFLPALEYLSANYTAENIELQVLWLAVEQQKRVVDRIARQVEVAKQGLDAATLGLERAQSQDLAGLTSAEQRAFIKSFFDPLNISQVGQGGDGNSDRARLDFAKDALNRAQTSVNQLVGDLRGESTALQVAVDKYTAAAKTHFGMLADIERLRIHVKDNIIYYMQAIWTYEPPDQRYFRLYNLDVPTFEPDVPVTVSLSTGLAQFDKVRPGLDVSLPPPRAGDQLVKLYEIADLDNLLGFKGNYMIFPMTDFNYMTWFLIHKYIHVDDATGVTAQDPDEASSLSIAMLQRMMASIIDATSFAQNKDAFEDLMCQLLSRRSPEMMIVPSDSLYIEALPGTHPLLEDFKLIHRAIDVKRAQAEARKAELENLRLAARLSRGDLGDPDVDRVVVVGEGQGVTVDAGQ